MIATLVPFFARVPITRHHTGNAIHSSQDIYHGHYIRQQGGPSLTLPPSAVDFRDSNSPPVPALGRRRRFPPFLLPRGEPQVANPTNLAIRFCKITHKDLPFALATPPLPPAFPRRVARPVPQSVLLSSRVLHVGTWAGAVRFSPRLVQGPREFEA